MPAADRAAVVTAMPNADGVIEDSELNGRVVFLVGVMRSGTNWLQRMLTARPGIFGLPTETLLLEWVHEFQARFQHDNLGSLTVGRPYVDRRDFRYRMRVFCDGVLRAYAPAELPPRVMERSPAHVKRLDVISEIYPDAYVVHIIRDGRDVARSLLNMDFGPNTLEAAATEWKTSVEDARRRGAGMQHYLEVRYEDLLARPEVEMPRLFDGLGMAATAAQMDQVLAEGRLRYNVDPLSRTIASDKWKESFSQDDAAQFDEIAGDTLANLGYSASTERLPKRTPQAPAAARTARRWGFPRRRSSIAKDPVRADLASKSRQVDGLIAALMAGSREQLQPLLAVDCRIQLVSGDEVWRGQGDEALGRLVKTAQDDPALGGRQLRIRQYPSPRQWVVIATFEVGSSVQHRVIVLGLAGDNVSNLAYHTLI
jgi:hypothetical protein